MTGLRVAYVGNFRPPHSTENDVRRALTRGLGHVVVPYQEDDLTGPAWRSIDPEAFDMLLWTRTWDHRGDAHSGALWCLERFDVADVPTVAFHLDRWWGLGREAEIAEHPMFRCDIVCTADGGHPDDWARIGIVHRWLPPAVDEWSCEPALSDRRWRSRLAFVGSWRGGYHPEWRHRPELVQWLRTNYGAHVKFWPDGRRVQSVRGDDLRTLYASVDVVVGDSCLVGSPARYWSDRVPETVGRGGFLLHPRVVGMAEHFTDGEHLACWDAGDWDGLRELIDRYLGDPRRRAEIAEAGRAHVLAHHTYTVRMAQLLELAGLT